MALLLPACLPKFPFWWKELLAASSDACVRANDLLQKVNVPWGALILTCAAPLSLCCPSALLSSCKTLSWVSPTMQIHLDSWRVCSKCGNQNPSGTIVRNYHLLLFGPTRSVGPFNQKCQTPTWSDHRFISETSRRSICQWPPGWPKHFFLAD